MPINYPSSSSNNPNSMGANRRRSSSLPNSYVVPAGQASGYKNLVYGGLEREPLRSGTHPPSPRRTGLPEGYVPLAAMTNNRRLAKQIPFPPASQQNTDEEYVPLVAMSKNTRLPRQFPSPSTSQQTMDEQYVPLAAMSRNNRLATLRRNKQTFLNQNQVTSINDQPSAPNVTLPDTLPDLPSPQSTVSSHSSDRLSGIINNFPSIPTPQRVPSPAQSTSSRGTRRESILQLFPAVPPPPQVPLPELPGRRRYSSLGNIGQLSEMRQICNPQTDLNTGYSHNTTGFVNIEDYYVGLPPETPEVRRKSSFSRIRRLSGSFRKMFKRGKGGE
ncbi:hypothetical protein DFH28DRAFT_1097382 [Melampsora americana]|nr:hypothetical protein DFH28DRAFT_1097382 [Melampsora americana]